MRFSGLRGQERPGVRAGPGCLSVHRQQHDAAIGGDATAVESRCDFFAGNGWKREGQKIIVSHGGRGRRETREWVV
jgi:hypothetical protein